MKKSRLLVKTTYLKTKNFMKLKFLLLIFIAFISTPLLAQDEDKLSDEAEEAALAKATQNPLAAMYSLPFQNNTTFGVGPFDNTQNVLNIQPVIPIGLGKNINLINRIIIPVITQPSYIEDKSSTGIGGGSNPSHTTKENLMRGRVAANSPVS